MSDLVKLGENQQGLTAGIRAVAPVLFTAMVFSAFINILMFTSPLYMLQIYDRVVTSRSENTLLAITALAAMLMVVYAILEGLRSRILVRAGLIYDDNIAGSVFGAIHRANIRTPARHVQCLRDVDVLREFLTGTGLIALCDFPWFPIFVAAAFLLHPWFGYISIVGSLITLGLTLLTEIVTRKPLGAANLAAARASQSAQAMFRNTEILQAMGMVGVIKRLWLAEHDTVLEHQATASDRAGVIMTVTKFSRFFLQIVILGTGAFLVIEKELSPGSIVAASILIGRALQPIEMAVANWKGFMNARASYRRLQNLFKTADAGATSMMRLPKPKGMVRVETVLAAAPGQNNTLILKGVSFDLAAGEMLGIVGPSAAGKSTLARVLVGVWPILKGTVRLDGNDISHWDPQELGPHIGYLPQDIELFTGTVAQNIARFSDCDPWEIIEAARLAGCHDLIQRFSAGYNTQIGENGQCLSGGQRQRIGLARALFRKPPFIVLDEPNASLDSAGEEALLQAMQHLKCCGSTLVVISHKVNILASADKILVMSDGVAQGFGSRDTILPQLIGPRIVAATHDSGSASHAASSTGA